MVTARHKIEQQPAFVLHSHPWRETSLIVEFFSRDYGRLPLVAKGARRPTSAFRGSLLSFQPVLADWSGRGEVRTLVRVEWQGGLPLLAGRALLCGYYINELLLRLLAREDAHPKLFEHYAEALAALAAGSRLDRTLRRFEFALLRELGYQPQLEVEADSGEAVIAAGSYVFIIEHGIVAAGDGGDGQLLSGRALLDMASGEFAHDETLQQAKQLSRRLINHHLGGQDLHSRRVFTEFQEL